LNRVFYALYITDLKVDSFIPSPSCWYYYFVFIYELNRVFYALYITDLKVDRFIFSPSCWYSLTS
jgi:hypothetical protein